MPDNIHYIYCDYCKRYYIDIFFEYHRNIHKYMRYNTLEKYNILL